MNLPRMWSALLLSLLVSASALGINQTPSIGPPNDTSADELSIDDLVVCEDTANNCTKQSCIDVCVRSGEDPMECPLYCNQHAAVRSNKHLCKR